MSDPPAAPPSKGLSNAEKKKQAKAEKAARRAQDRGPAPSTLQPDEPSSSSSSQAKPKLPQESDSTTTLPTRRRPSMTTTATSATAGTPQQPKEPPPQPKDPAPPSKQIPFLHHLYEPRHASLLSSPSKETHPAIQILALQQSSYQICGSHARCIALLLALTTVIRAYTTPPSTSLPRHLPTSHLSPHLAWLKAHSRPFNAAQANAIRWLKRTISRIDPSLPEDDAKKSLCADIDTFVRERLTVADEVIAAAASKAHIRPGASVLVYGNSAVVRAALAHAVRAGIRPLRIVVVDSRPLHEGRALGRSLVAAVDRLEARRTHTRDGDDDDGEEQPPIEISLTTLTSLAHAVTQSTLCLLGASAIHTNGTAQARSGTALVAMMAKDQRIPVIFLAEGVKFVERAALDALGPNELGPEDELVDAITDDAAQGGGDAGGKEATLNNWRTTPNIHLLHPLYDVTPSDLIDAIVTEYGSVAPSAAASVQRLAGLGLGDEA